MVPFKSKGDVVYGLAQHMEDTGRLMSPLQFREGQQTEFTLQRKTHFQSAAWFLPLHGSHSKIDKIHHELHVLIIASEVGLRC